MNGVIRNAALLGCAVLVVGSGCSLRTGYVRSCDGTGGCATATGCGPAGGCGAVGGAGGHAGGAGGGAGKGRGIFGGAKSAINGESPATLPCCTNRDLYDPCWPERYSNLAVREVNLAFTPQVVNGHVLDQTIWNHHFDKGTDKLTGGGMAALQMISRRRPHPDCTIYLATALDLDYDPCCPERYAGATNELNSLRLAAVQKYLVALNSGRPLDFQVLVHDPADVTITSGPALGPNPVNIAVTGMSASFRGSLSGGGGGTAGPTGSVGGLATPGGR